MKINANTTTLIPCSLINNRGFVFSQHANVCCCSLLKKKIISLFQRIVAWFQSLCASPIRPPQPPVFTAAPVAHQLEQPPPPVVVEPIPPPAPLPNRDAELWDLQSQLYEIRQKVEVYQAAMRQEIEEEFEVEIARLMQIARDQIAERQRQIEAITGHPQEEEWNPSQLVHLIQLRKDHSRAAQRHHEMAEMEGIDQETKQRYLNLEQEATREMQKARLRETKFHAERHLEAYAQILQDLDNPELEFFFQEERDATTQRIRQIQALIEVIQPL